MSRTINGVTTYFIWDDWNLIEERDSSGGLLQSYIHGRTVDDLVAKVDQKGAVYYHQDGLGSTVALTNQDGDVVENYSYKVFGEPTITNDLGQTLSSSTKGNRFLYTGREWMSELAIYDYRNRIYSAELGRFLQTDPIRFEAGDVNIYRYVENSPSNYIDPLGEAWSLGSTALGAGIGALGNLAQQVTEEILGKGDGDIEWCDVGKAATAGGVVGAMFGAATGDPTALAAGLGLFSAGMGGMAAGLL